MAPMSGIVIQCIVPGAAIVPHSDRPPRPVHTAGEALVARMREQELQQGLTLASGHVLKPQRERWIDVKPFAARLRMRANYRVSVFGCILSGMRGHAFTLLRRWSSAGILA